MRRGGFDVVIGNPPYVEYKDVREQYRVMGFETESCGDLYAFVMERALVLMSKSGRLGMIVPISVVSTDGFGSLRGLLLRGHRTSWSLSFAERPSKLFTGVEKRLMNSGSSPKTLLTARSVSLGVPAMVCSGKRHPVCPHQVRPVPEGQLLGQHFSTQSLRSNRTEYSPAARNRSSFGNLFPADFPLCCVLYVEAAVLCAVLWLRTHHTRRGWSKDRAL